MTKKIKTRIALLCAGAVALPALVAVAQPLDNKDAGSWRAQRRAAIMQQYDVDHDGTLSPEERAAMRHDFAMKRFQALDTNKDGLLTPAEFEAGMGMFRHHHRRGHFGPRGGGPGPNQK